MSRVRFHNLVQNTVRYPRYGDDQPASRTQLGSSPPEQQSPELPDKDRLVSMTQTVSSLPEYQSHEVLRGDDQLHSMTPPTSSPPEQQSSEVLRGGDPQTAMTKKISERRARAAIKKSMRFLLRPVKSIGGPVARYIRRYFVGYIEALLGHILSLAETLHARQTSLEIRQGNLEAHQASLEAHQASLEAHQASLEAHQASLEAHQASLENRQATLETRQGTLQELVQGLSHSLLDVSGRLEHALELERRALELLHSKVDDLGLRSRGVVPIGVNTVVMRTYDGYVFVPRSDDGLLLMLLDAGPGGLEPGTRRMLTTFLSPGMTFVDVGAHVGLLTLAGARAVGPTGKVLAIEPAPMAFEALRRSIEVSGLAGGVQAIRQAVGAHPERRTFYVRNILGHSSLTPLDSDSEAGIEEVEVELSPLDNLLQMGERVDLVKIDVEGWELAVLAGMTRIIAENPYLVIIAEFGSSHLRARQIAPQDWFASFRNHGFEPLVIDESSGKCRPVNLSDLANIKSANILFARKPATLSRALL